MLAPNYALKGYRQRMRGLQVLIGLINAKRDMDVPQ